VYRRLASYMRDHFGNDDMGKRKAFYFYPWHFNFLVR
jgi:tRNA-dihydrouridine synthase 3